MHYAAPPARQPMFDGARRRTPCPNADRACAEVLSLPIHAQLTDAEVDPVCAAVAGFS
jgi:dTDP-4-amino-4,6-dideoxygalactose transaminase